MHRSLFALGALVGLSACAHYPPTLTYLGPTGPARGADCQVELLPGPPPGPVTNIAIAHCPDVGSHDCNAEIRRMACEAGADLAYGVHTEKLLHDTDVVATLATRDRR